MFQSILCNVQVAQCLLMFDTTTKRHRGFGFVTLETEDIVDKICEERFHKINDKRVCMFISYKTLVRAPFM